MIFLLGLMVIGLAGLAGGQVWAITGSTSLAWLAGGAVCVPLTWLVRGWTRRRRGPSFVGEVQEHIEEGDFTTLVPGQNAQRQRVRKRVIDQPGQVANSIRSMLDDKKMARHRSGLVA